jgi:hypothetical protein
MPVEGLSERMYEFIEIASSNRVETPKDAQQGRNEQFSRGYWHAEEGKKKELPSDNINL